MSERIKVAAVQLSSGEDKEENIQKTSRLIHEARVMGARLVALPELFNCYTHLEDMVKQAESIPGPTIKRLAGEANRLGIYILCGSIMEAAGKGKVFNTSVMLSPEGKVLATYRKMHLFDVNIPNVVNFAESRFISPGRRLARVELDGLMVGIAICYDLRFPELFRALSLKGVEAILLPSAFTAYTGKDHWEILLRARAIENQAYIVAPNQFGTHPNRITTYGHSMIVDPWGTVLSQAQDKEGIIYAELDLCLLQEIRKRLPTLKKRLGV